jgi:hypothetical protein
MTFKANFLKIGFAEILILKNYIFKELLSNFMMAFSYKLLEMREN